MKHAMAYGLVGLALLSGAAWAGEQDRAHSEASGLRPPAEALLVIGFDDGSDSDYRFGFADMTARGIRGTSFINTGRIGERGKLTWAQIHEMIAAGWDIQCHAHDHIDLTTLDEAEIRQQIEQVDGAFIAQGLPAPEHHTYPYFRYNARAQSVVGEYRKTMRTKRTVFNTYETMDFSAYPSFSVDMQTEEQLEDGNALIDAAIADRSILCVHLHRITEGEPTNPWQCRRTLFQSWLDYAVASGIRIVTTSEMYDIVRLVQSEAELRAGR